MPVNYREHHTLLFEQRSLIDFHQITTKKIIFRYNTFYIHVYIWWYLVLAFGHGTEIFPLDRLTKFRKMKFRPGVGEGGRAALQKLICVQFVNNLFLAEALWTNKTSSSATVSLFVRRAGLSSMREVFKVSKGNKLLNWRDKCVKTVQTSRCCQQQKCRSG